MATRSYDEDGQSIPLIDRPQTRPQEQHGTSPLRRAHARSTSMDIQDQSLSNRFSVPRFTTTQYVPLGSIELSGEPQENTAEAPKIYHNSFIPTWLPLPLSLPAVLGLLGLTITLLLIVIIIHWISVKTNGLCRDDGSNPVYFAWRFLPTLIAVVYVFWCMIVLDETARTEVFARLARPEGATAAASILRTSKPWWTTFRDSFPSRTNRNFSWALFCASSIYILGILLISPFSSALLASENVTILTKTTFEQYVLATPTTLDLDTLVRYQTIGHILQNVTTSAWLSDEFSVLPFWPSNLADAPFGAALAASPQTWKAQTPVYQSELTCEPMSVTAAAFNHSFSALNSYNETLNKFEILLTFKMQSTSGCQYGIAFSDDTPYVIQNNASYWSDVSSMTFPNIWSYSYVGDIISDLEALEDIAKTNNRLFNITDGCNPGEIMVGFSNSSGTITAAATFCRHNYFTSNLTVTATTSGESTSISFDRNHFLRERVPIDPLTLNTTNFDQQFLNDSWSAYIVDPTARTRPDTGGPANVLTALHNFTTIDKIEHSTLVQEASKIKQRTFGEALMSRYKIQSASSVRIAGETAETQRRIVVVQAIAITLEVVLFSQAVLLIGVILSTRLIRRPLGVQQNPALTNTIVSMVVSQSRTKQSLKDFHLSSREMLEDNLKDKVYTVRNGALLTNSSVDSSDDTLPPKLHSSYSLEPRKPPSALVTWRVVSLCILLFAVLGTLAILYWYSIHDSLSQAAFVYETQIEIAGRAYGVLAPYSILPTLLAVAIGLWWGSLESVFRRSQPFIDQGRAPTVSKSGSGISYQSSYLLWSAFRALLRNHWLLALMSTGAFLTQILTISMSALWTREPWQQVSSTEALQHLQLRQIPHIRPTYVSPRNRNGAFFVGDVMSDAVANLQTNWMYSAAIQLTLNGSQPPWSDDGWSFVPVEIPARSEINRTQDAGSEDTTATATNATIKTGAIRARLECSTWPEVRPSQWLTEYDLTNATKWNTSANSNTFSNAFGLGCDDNGQARYINFQPNTTSSATPCEYIGGIADFRAAGETMLCCASGEQDEPGLASLGLWSPSYHPGQYYGGWPFLTWPTNITAKWITGNAFMASTNGSDDELVWPTVPRLTAIDCKPIIERANASVTIDVSSNKVQHKQLLGEWVADESAWGDAFVQHENPNTTAYSSGDFTLNVTTSYGVMFLEALLGLSSIHTLQGCGTDSCPPIEQLSDRNFNIRMPGFNLDYMSYAMLSLANNDTSALHDPAIMIPLAQKTFTTFFQHFASMDVEVDGDGGWVYQKANATLPADLGKPTWAPADLIVPPAQVTGSGVQPVILPLLNSTQTITIERPIEILLMSPLAVWICLIIIAWLIGTTILVLILKKRYFSPLLRPVESVADIAVLVAGSERLLRLAEEKGARGLQADKNNFKTRLGWFRTSTREIRWGIELVEPGVEFLTEEEVRQLSFGKQ